MKFIPAQLLTNNDDGTVTVNTRALPVLELTRRNLETLLEKLTDPNSMCSLIDPTGQVLVRAVPNDKHYSDRSPGEVYTNGQRK